MFKPQINVTLGNQRKARKDDTTTESTEIDWDLVGQKAAIAQQTAETIAKVVVGLYVAKKLVDTACEIALIASDAHFNK